MKIPKQRTVQYEVDGKTYIKTKDIRFPLVSYILGWPLRKLRILQLQLKIHGILKIPNTSEPNIDNKSEQAECISSKVTVEDINIGQPIKGENEASFKHQGNTKNGNYSVDFEYVDSDSDFGSDVIEFVFKDSQGDTVKVYHMPSYFLYLMFSDGHGITGKFLSEAYKEELYAFQHNLLINNSKSLIDDRTYQNIQLSGQDFEVKLKYIGLRVYLAAKSDVLEHLYALLSGVICDGDFLEPFILKIPLNIIFESSTALYDSDEKLWMSI